MTSHGRARDGFILLSVIWVMAALAVLCLSFTLVAHRALRSSRNRIAETRAQWNAEACVAIARGAVDMALAKQSVGGDGAEAVWRILDEAIGHASLSFPAGCTISIRPVGTAVDVNSADGDMLRRLFSARGLSPAKSDSVIAAILDWRDTDTLPRRFGAEASWYRAHSRPLPRNAPFADVRELTLVRGFDEFGSADSIFTSEPGRIDVNHASPIVLAALPGLTEETIERIREHQRHASPVADLLKFAGELSPESRESLMRSYGELMNLMSTEPDAWLVTARAHSGTPAITTVLEERLVRAGANSDVSRRRLWLE